MPKPSVSARKRGLCCGARCAEAFTRKPGTWDGANQHRLLKPDTVENAPYAMPFPGRTQQRKRLLQTGTVARRLRLDGVGSARIGTKGIVHLPGHAQWKKPTQSFTARISNRKAVRMMVDIVEIKSAIRAGEITVYQKGGRLYMENKAGERIEITVEGGEENG
jgi:hypothetical protein